MGSVIDQRRVFVSFNRKPVVSSALLAVAFCFAASRADAQKGIFDLPVEVHWGSTVLEPGEYTVDVPVSQPWPHQIYLIHNGKLLSIVLPEIENSGLQFDSSWLHLVSVHGAYYVEKYDSAATGKEFTFWVPKAEQGGLTIKVKHQS